LDREFQTDFSLKEYVAWMLPYIENPSINMLSAFSATLENSDIDFELNVLKGIVASEEF